MKIRIYALLLAGMMSMPLLGMKRGLEDNPLEQQPMVQPSAHQGQAEDQVTLTDDCKALIVAQLDSKTRNILMKVNRFYHFFASPRNIMQLISHGIKLSPTDNDTRIFQALHAKNKELVATLLQQMSYFEHNFIKHVCSYLFTMPLDTFQQFYALLPQEGKKHIALMLEIDPERTCTTWLPLYKAVTSNCLPADETWDSLVKKHFQGPVKKEIAISFFIKALWNNNTECVKALIKNQSFNTILQSGTQIQQPIFWTKKLAFSCSAPTTTMFDSILEWLFSQRFNQNEGVHSLRQKNIVYECGLKIIDINKHQYLERFLLSIKEKSYFNALILQLLCYACEYKKYDSITTLLSHTKTPQEQPASVSDYSDHEYLRQYKQVLAALFLDNHNDALNINIVSLCKSFIAADNKEYLRITLDTMAEQPCFTHVATPLLQYALEKKNDACVRILLAYHDKLVPHTSHIVQPSTAAEANRVRNEWIPIVRALLKQDDTNVLCEIMQWMIQSTPDLLLNDIFKPLAPDILDGEEKNTLDALEKILKAFQAVAPYNTKCTEIINNTLSGYLDAAITSEQPAGHIIERLLNTGAYPSSGLQSDIVTLADNPTSFNSLIGFLNFLHPSASIANLSSLSRFKEQNPALFAKLAMLCKTRQAAFVQEQRSLLAQQHEALQNALPTLKPLIAHGNIDAIQRLLSIWNSRAFAPVIAQALAFVQEQRKILFEKIIDLKCDRSNPNAQLLVQSLTGKRDILGLIQEMLTRKHAQCQYATY